MKKILKLLMMFVVALALTGCVKVRCQIDITDKDDVVTIGLKDFEKLSDDVKIVSEVSESSSNTGLIIGIIAVIVVIGAGAFYFYKKKSKSNKDNLD